jgi:hypothetical protein
MLRTWESALRTQKSHTRGGGPNPSLRIEKLVELDIEHSLPEATSVYVPSEADHLLCSCKSMDHIVQLGPQARIIEHGELVEPGVVDEASVAQPVNRELGVVGIWNDGCNYTDLGVKNEVRIRSAPTMCFESTRRASRLTSAPASGPVVS